MRVLSVITLVFACAGCAPDPVFLSVDWPNDTTNTEGPYRIEALVEVPKGLSRFELFWRTGDDDRFVEIAMEPLGDEDDGSSWWAGEIGGRPAGTRIEFYLLIHDQISQQARFPDPSKAETVAFEVLP